MRHGSSSGNATIARYSELGHAVDCFVPWTRKKGPQDAARKQGEGSHTKTSDLTSAMKASMRGTALTTRTSLRAAVGSDVASPTSSSIATSCVGHTPYIEHVTPSHAPVCLTEVCVAVHAP